MINTEFAKAINHNPDSLLDMGFKREGNTYQYYPKSSINERFDDLYMDMNYNWYLTSNNTRFPLQCTDIAGLREIITSTCQ